MQGAGSEGIPCSSGGLGNLCSQCCASRPVGEGREGGREGWAAQAWLGRWPRARGKGMGQATVPRCSHRLQ